MTENPELSIPLGDYEVQVGRSYKSRRVQYHTLRYDFKPKSATGGKVEQYLNFGGNGDVQVAVPSDTNESLTLYKGGQKSVKNDKECLLIFDPRTKTLRLEKLNSHIALKKTRDNDPEVETAFKNEIDKLRQTRTLYQPQGASDADLSGRMSPEMEGEAASAASQLHMSTSDSSSSSDESDNSNSSDDEDDSDSERLMGEMEKLKTIPTNDSMPFIPPSHPIPATEEMLSSDDSMSDDDVQDMMEKQLNAVAPNEPRPDVDSMPDFDELLAGVASERTSPQQPSRPPTASPLGSPAAQPSQPQSVPHDMLHDDLQLSESSDDE